MEVRKPVLVVGATGQLGSDIVTELKRRDVPYIGEGSRGLDITNDEEVEHYFKNSDFSCIIDAAAYTKVDLAETEKYKNYAVNVHGTENLVKICKDKNIPFVYFSTDYVFGGDGDTPYKETDEKHPEGEYAKSKSEAEDIITKELTKYFILRISWVFGKNGSNFIKTMLRMKDTQKELTVVSDQVGSPTYTVDVANVVCDMINTDKYGIYHVTNEGFVSWADFARLIFRNIGSDVIVHDISTEAYGAKAKRPKNSRLDKTKLREQGFGNMPTYENALDRFLKEMGY